MKPDSESHHRLLWTAFAILFILGAGTMGYMVLEKWSLLDSVYMTVITITTVGFKEVHDLTNPITRLFTIGVILFGVGTALYGLGTFTQTLVEAQVRNILGRRRVERKIKSLSNHIILCGFGRVGSAVTRELQKEGVPFVVIEKDPSTLHKIEHEDILFLQGDATEEETLSRAGIEKARGLISTLTTDAENVYVILTARGLNPKLFIVARAAEIDAERKLIRAGADRVVSPYSMSGKRIANIMLRPTVVDFMESSLYHPTMDLVIEEVYIPETASLVGIQLVDSGLRSDYGLTIMAIRRGTGEMVVNPGPAVSIQGGDILIALGKRSDFRRLQGSGLLL